MMNQTNFSLLMMSNIAHLRLKENITPEDRIKAGTKVSAWRKHPPDDVHLKVDEIYDIQQSARRSQSGLL